MKAQKTSFWFAVVGVVLFLFIILRLLSGSKSGDSVLRSILPMGMLGKKRGKITRKYMTMPEFQNKMTQVANLKQQQIQLRS